MPLRGGGLGQQSVTALGGGSGSGKPTSNPFCDGWTGGGAGGFGGTTI